MPGESLVSSLQDEGGDVAARFLLGALVGAASAGFALIVMEGEGEDVPGEPGDWLLGGAIVGGILFAFDF